MAALPSSVVVPGSNVTIIAWGFSSNSDRNVSSRVAVICVSCASAAVIAVVAATVARRRRA
jgi:hypothetical protein